MASGREELDRMKADDLLTMHLHAVTMRNLAHEKIGGYLGPLYNRLEALIEDIEMARRYPSCQLDPQHTEEKVPALATVRVRGVPGVLACWECYCLNEGGHYLDYSSAIREMLRGEG